MATDETASRDPTFVIKALDKNKRMWNVATVQTMRNDGDVRNLHKETEQAVSVVQLKNFYAPHLAQIEGCKSTLLH